MRVGVADNGYMIFLDQFTPLPWTSLYQTRALPDINVPHWAMLAP